MAKTRKKLGAISAPMIDALQKPQAVKPSATLLEAAARIEAMLDGDWPCECYGKPDAIFEKGELCPLCDLRAAIKRENKPKRVNPSPLLLVAETIRLFREDCEAESYTDTGDAWAILDIAESVLRAAESKSKGAIK